jgi:hypothetical protein
MTRDAIEDVRLLAPLAEPPSECGRARQRRKLTNAIAAESMSVRQPRPLEPESPVVSTGQAGHRRIHFAGIAAAAVAAVGVAIPLAIGTHAPAATRVTKRVAPVLKLASYRLRLPSTYRLTSATAPQCPVGVTFSVPESAPTTWTGGRTGSASPVQTPAYASDMNAAANAEGGCVTMALAPPYTPTPTNPDPEAGTLEDTPPIQIGPYEGRVGTWTSYAKPSGVASQQASLYVEIPIGGGQTQDLVVSANSLSESALVSLVADGLSVAGSSPTSVATNQTPNTSGPTGATGTAGGAGGASASNRNS